MTAHNRAAIVLTAFAAGSTTPEAIVYIVGKAPARRLYAGIVGSALLGEMGDGGKVIEEDGRIAETGARETRVGYVPGKGTVRR